MDLMKSPTSAALNSLLPAQGVESGQQPAPKQKKDKVKKLQ